MCNNIFCKSVKLNYSLHLCISIKGGGHRFDCVLQGIMNGFKMLSAQVFQQCLLKCVYIELFSYIQAVKAWFIWFCTYAYTFMYIVRYIKFLCVK